MARKSGFGGVTSGTGFVPTRQLAYVGREYWSGEDDEQLDFTGDKKSPIYGFHYVSEIEARQLATCDWLNDEIRHEHAGDGEDDARIVDNGRDNDPSDIGDAEERTSYDDIEVVERVKEGYRQMGFYWDDRRLRHGDATRKMLGGHHGRRNCYDSTRSELVPTEVLFLTPGPDDDTCYVESVPIK